MKLFYKLFGFLLIGIIGLVGLEGYLDFQSGIAQFEKGMTDNAIQIAKIISELIEHTWIEGSNNKALLLINNANNSNDQVKIRLVCLEKSSNPHSLPNMKPAKLDLIKQGKIASVKIAEKGTMGSSLYTYIPIKSENHPFNAIEIRQSLSPLAEYKDKFFIRSLKIGFLLFIISALILYNVINHLMQKGLNRLSAKAKQICKGNIEPDLKISGNDELSEIGTTINKMCVELQSAQKKIDSVHEARIKTLEQLRHTERLSTVGHISAGIAHEMGTPLNIVSGRAKMIEAGTLPLDEIIRNAAIIRSQSDRMTQIITQLLDFTRRRKPIYTSANILSLIKQVFEIMAPIAREKGVALQLAQSEKIQILLRMDTNQIQQVMINLIINSIQAMPNGGTIDLELAEKETADINTSEVKTYLVMKFSDDGDGIDKENIDHIFEPFFTTKKIREGTGLGLPIVQGIIKEHSGWIEVEAKKAKGVSFIIYLPMGKGK